MILKEKTLILKSEYNKTFESGILKGKSFQFHIFETNKEYSVYASDEKGDLLYLLRKFSRQDSSVLGKHFELSEVLEFLDTDECEDELIYFNTIIDYAGNEKL